ncbi:RE1-silencing transcription factor-like [Anoplophora glabripennis]|uniref:RE1-silencing transcription factor-like n=1 Tax=Anoplophora glabripennis TaxID=217634 RepID=UPI000873F800|nr:RE1-silencing transcription factor-like [Anoplophora glabripennis]
MNTDKTIIPYVDSEKMLQLDLREVYMQEKKSELVDISDSQKICRLCMQPVVSESKCIGEAELDAIQKLTPEMNINIIKDPVVCKPCFDSLCTHNSFLKDCLEVEEKTKSTFDSSVTESQIDTSSLNLFVKTENLDKKFDINGMEMSIKAESIDIKSEDEEMSDTPLQSSDIVPFEQSIYKGEEEEGCKHDNGSEMKTKQEHKVLYKDNKCIYKSGSETHFTTNDSEVYKCESCEYKTENKKSLQRHLSRHKDTLKVQMFNDCNYETIYKRNMEMHQLKHKRLSQVQICKYDNCSFETKYRFHMKRHQLKHKDPLQVQI